MSKKKGWTRSYQAAIKIKSLPEGPRLYSLLASILLNVSLKVSPMSSKNIGRACPAHSFPWSMDAGKHVNPKILHE